MQARLRRAAVACPEPLRQEPCAPKCRRCVLRLLPVALTLILYYSRERGRGGRVCLCSDSALRPAAIRLNPLCLLPSEPCPFLALVCLRSLRPDHKQVCQ